MLSLIPMIVVIPTEVGVLRGGQTEQGGGQEGAWGAGRGGGGGQRVFRTASSGTGVEGEAAKTTSPSVFYCSL